MLFGRAEVTYKSGKKVQLFIMGLSRLNLIKLEAGAPLHVTRQKHGEGVPEGWEIMIYFGETEDAIQEALKAEGMMGPDTIIHRDPKLGGKNS